MKTKILLLITLAFASISFAQAGTASATVGDEVTLTAKAAGSVPFTYEWYKNGVKQTTIPNTTAALVLPNVQISDGGTWKVDIINSAGHSMSNDVVFTVAPVVIPPSGGSLTFSKK